jgi:hypothetical protein
MEIRSLIYNLLSGLFFCVFAFYSLKKNFCDDDIKYQIFYGVICIIFLINAYGIKK